MPKCNDSEIGDRLYAYELGALPEEEMERVEIHVLKCEYCLSQLASFEREAALLSSDDDVRDLVRQAVKGESLQSRSVLRWLWLRIWPDTPLVFRPALAYLILLLLIFPAYQGLKRPASEQIRAVQSILLLPGRSVADDAFKISLGDEGLLTFVHRGAVAGRSYQVTIQSEDGRVVYRNEAFSSFDEYETGRLLLPLGMMKPGDYLLVITNPRPDAPVKRQEYRFGIAK